MSGNGAGPSNGNVTRLPTSQAAPQPEPASRATGLHGAAITVMASCAILGIVLVFVLITLNWSSELRRTLTVILILTAVAFIASAMTAVFAAARDTYPRRER